MHPQYIYKKPKFETRLYERPMTISKSRSRCKTPVRNLQHPQKPQMRTLKDMNVLCRELKLRTGVYQGLLTVPKSRSRCQAQSGTSSILKSLKSGLKRHGHSMHLQDLDREPKFRTWVYHRPVTISKFRSRYKTPVRNPQHPPKPQIRP